MKAQHTSAEGCGYFDIPTPPNATHEAHYDPDGERQPLDLYAWPGAYPLIYYADDGATFCGRHAWAVIVREDVAMTREEHLEGPSQWCDEGSHEMHSAYGDPEEEQEEATP